MKKIYWNLFGKEVIFNLNWFEFIMLKRIFKKKKYECLKSKQIRGQKINFIIVDEASNPEKVSEEFSKEKLLRKSKEVK